MKGGNVNMFELFDVYEQRGEDRGRQAAVDQIILNALHKGMTPDEISEICNVSVERVLAVRSTESNFLQPV